MSKKIESKNEFASKQYLHLLTFSTFDFLAHSFRDPKLLKNNSTLLAKWRKEVPTHKDGSVDSEPLIHDLTKKIMSEKLQPGVNPLGSFGHIYGGYESGYYSYLWSRVYSADLFA